MHHLLPFVTLLTAAAPALAQNSASIISLMIVDTVPVSAPTPTIVARIQHEGNSEITYGVTCLPIQTPNPTAAVRRQRPCQLIDGALIAFKPESMVLNLRRDTQTITVNPKGEELTTLNYIDEVGTAYCSINKKSSMECNGHMTMLAREIVLSGKSTVKPTEELLSVSTISTAFATDDPAHFIPVTLTTNGASSSGAFLSETTLTTVATPTASGGSDEATGDEAGTEAGAAGATSSESTGAGPRATQHAVLVGVMAVVGGMAIM